jgi:hypothetical protein
MCRNGSGELVYLSNSFGPKERARVASGEYAGWLVSPQTRGIPSGVQNGDVWAGDNCCFLSSFTPDGFTAWLEQMKPYRATCLFIVAPDVLGDCWATLDRWQIWRPKLMADWPLAFVGQDGLPMDRVPWEMDTYFVGGTDAWKDSAESLAIVRECRRRGVPVHVGRANTHSRLTAFYKAYRLDGDPPDHLSGFTYDGNGIRWRSAAELAPADAVLRMERLL